MAEKDWNLRKRQQVVEGRGGKKHRTISLDRNVGKSCNAQLELDLPYSMMRKGGNATD